MKFQIFFVAAWGLASVVESSPANNLKRAIKIYNGPGVSGYLVDEAVNLFSKLLSSTKYSVHKTTPEELADPKWMFKTDLLVIPGGQATPYSQSLEGKANTNIINYVNNGGKFFGICAGAYYASRETQFMVGTPYEKRIQRNLRFFDGVSKGITFPGYIPNSEAGARVVKITLRNPFEVSNSKTSVYYNGGGAFIDTAKFPSVEVLATYDGIKSNENVAAILVPVGRGKAILSHFHPEYIPDRRGEYLYNELNPDKNKIENLLNAWFRQLGLKLSNDDKKNKFHQTSYSRERGRINLLDQRTSSLDRTLLIVRNPQASKRFNRKRSRSSGDDHPNTRRQRYKITV